MTYLNVAQQSAPPRSSIYDMSLKSSRNGVRFGSTTRHGAIDPVKQAVRLVAQNRPVPLRTFDQIPMREQHLLKQTCAMAPSLAHATVAFVGDYDCTSLVLGMLGNLGYPRPAHMLMLDFDERLLMSASRMARNHGFADILETRRYNVFDKVPAELVGQFDWFYTNPPYGSHNVGASARLFISRGCELTCATGGHGCIILPYAPDRPWTIKAMRATQESLIGNEWVIREVWSQAHQYDLDDDPDLPSSSIIIDRVSNEASVVMPYSGRHVEDDEIASFYGRNISPPFPRYISPTGEVDYVSND